MFTKVEAGINKAHTQKVKAKCCYGDARKISFEFLNAVGYNSGSIGIAYIGTFNKKLPNDKQLTAGFLLMQEGVKLKKLLPDYKIYAHRQLIASESPGATFFELIKKWPHWTQDVPENYNE